MEAKTVTLISNGGAVVDLVRVSADKKLPDVVIWGLNDKQRTFLHDKNNTYREASCIWATEAGRVY